MFKKKGSIVEKIVIIVTSSTQGVIKVKNGLLCINWYNDGINDIESVLKESFFSVISKLNKIILKIKKAPIDKLKVYKLVWFAFTLHIILQFLIHFSIS